MSDRACSGIRPKVWAVLGIASIVLDTLLAGAAIELVRAILP